MDLKPEGKYIEYKAAKNSLPKDFWESYSAFANTEGGKVLLGITDDLEIKGVNNPQKIQSELFTNLNNTQKVNRNLISDQNVSLKDFQDKKIIEVTIPEATISQKPIYLNQNPKQTWIREFETDRKATEEELKAMLRNSQDDLDSDLLSGFDISDLDETSLSEYKILLTQNDDRFLTMTDFEMLVEIGAYKRDRQITDKIVYKLTYGGLLFFGKYNSITSAQGLQNFHLDYFNYINTKDRWRDRVAPGEPGYPNINIFNFYRAVLSKLTATIDTVFELSNDLIRTNYIRDVEISLREALANSLIHTDYFAEESVKIEAYNTYIVSLILEK
ncbi:MULTISPECIES: helix-turn-helix domain-containing protein [unclassified Streptococcus]|uniref:AlbA family DNA-binding domain-containing protein n=1 Tax=unclassified Streptococcus TaxID=2608887 RepID=UPI001D161787|nr:MULTISPECIES: RNA-binding domain-containing protein [unclassified Streptococcus]